MSFIEQTILFNDQLLLIKRRIRESHLIPNYEVDVLKQWARADIILRKDGFLFLCEIIHDAEIIETFSE